MENSKTDFTLGNRRIIGQQQVRDNITRILNSGRLSHAYLLTGPPGVGKKAIALALAEAINGIDHLTHLAEEATSGKSSWLSHPDIHLFIPIPRSADDDELRRRRELLAEDPYEIIDFSMRPSLENPEETKNRQAFYAIDYFRKTIRPSALLTPNEGSKTVIILTDIEKMRKETANAFLKMLEEPGENVVFILTSAHPDQLLPTILSRCQILRLSPLSTEEIREGLMTHDGLSEDDAGYLAAISGGNYAKTRFYDTDTITQNRDEIIKYLRNAYVLQADKIVETAQQWQSNNNREGYITLLDMIELLIRDLKVYKHTQNAEYLNNTDQKRVIMNFCKRLPEARLDSMLSQIGQCRSLIYRNAQPKLLFTTLAFRLSSLMRGKDTPISEYAPWHHLPAFIDTEI